MPQILNLSPGVDTNISDNCTCIERHICLDSHNCTMMGEEHGTGGKDNTSVPEMQSRVGEEELGQAPRPLPEMYASILGSTEKGEESVEKKKKKNKQFSITRLLKSSTSTTNSLQGYFLEVCV